jgi:transposase
MKIHSKEVRQLALQALERGERRSEVSRMLCVPVPTLDRWRREFRRSGQNAPLPRGHRQAAFGEQELPLLEAQLRQNPDATLDRQVEQWRHQTGRPASRSSLKRALLKLGWTRKKRV